jgi:heme exporter protein B
MAILWKDVREEWRRRELVLVMALFSLVVLVMFSFALGIMPENPGNVAAGVLWIAFTFAGTLGLNRTLAMERENDTFHALLAAPADWSWVYAAKMTGSLLFLLLVQALVVPMALLAFNLDLGPNWPWLVVTCFLGSIGFVSLGTLLAGIASGTSVRDWMLPLLLFPLEVPVLIGAVRATAVILSGQPLDDIWIWLKLLVLFDAVFLAAGILTYESVVEE